MRSLLTLAFLKRVGEQYHFEEKHRELLFDAAEDMRAQLAGQEGFFCIRNPDFIVSLQLVKSNYIVFLIIE